VNATVNTKDVSKKRETIRREEKEICERNEKEEKWRESV
jgi:hypothetical protein